jgi:hypothetical protein
MDASIECTGCGRKLAYQRFHAGFGDEGFMYGTGASVVLTWSTYDPSYRRIVGDVHPWMLSTEQRYAVERALRDGLDGEPFGFDNQPVCPHCETALPSLFDPSRAYFVILDRRVDGDTEKVWR